MKLNFIKEIFDNPRRRRIAIGSIAVAVVFGFLFFSDFGLVKRIDMEWRKADLEQQIADETARRDSLRRQIEKVRTDMYEIEKIAREKYGMTRPGEKVYYLDIDKD
ncbi:MAG: FtsB family cell division protein [Candidatus Kapaibacterium sp.]